MTQHEKGTTFFCMENANIIDEFSMMTRRNGLNQQNWKKKISFMVQIRCHVDGLWKTLKFQVEELSNSNSILPTETFPLSGPRATRFSAEFSTTATFDFTKNSNVNQQYIILHLVYGERFLFSWRFANVVEKCKSCPAKTTRNNQTINRNWRTTEKNCLRALNSFIDLFLIY